jgi:hypothetical protein
MAFCDERKSPFNDVNRTFIVCNMCECSSSKGSTFGMRPPLRGAVFSLILLDTEVQKNECAEILTRLRDLHVI